MSLIQRVTFIDRGQDFLWWEIDAETGRILGCGPYEADLWASGRCSVDVATVAVGNCPTFFGPATEPEGRTLRYEIATVVAVSGITDDGMIWGLDLGNEVK
jgi:hypothetical protein